MSTKQFLIRFNQQFKPVSLLDEEDTELPLNEEGLVDLMYRLSEQEADAHISWSYEGADSSGWQNWSSLLASEREILFWYPNPETSMLQSLGTVFFSHPYFKYGSQTDRWPTWLVEPMSGTLRGSALGQVKMIEKHFPLFLLHLTYKGLQMGLMPYYHLGLKVTIERSSLPKFDPKMLIPFLGQHMKKWWLWQWWAHLPGNRLSLLPALVKGLISSSMPIKVDEEYQQKPITVDQEEDTIEVVIPTLQRKAYLAKVLEDLAKQHLLPQTVFIIEQNPDSEAASELKEVLARNYPFRIEHLFTHQMGACNARNVVIPKVTAKWLFLADDDIELQPHLLKKGVERLKALKIKAISFAISNARSANQSGLEVIPGFGSGCSIIEAASAPLFDESFELGYGEDTDYGVALREKTGSHIIRDKALQLIHHKAPTGGLRFRKKHPWHMEPKEPKPAPHILHFYDKNMTEVQRKGFQYHYLFPKSLSALLKYKERKHLWRLSEKWARTLK